jgi:hypothetical protein
MIRRQIRAAITASLAALALAGCAKVIDDKKAEDAIKQDFGRNTGLTATSVDCPGDVDVKTGDTFDCAVETNQGNATVILKILNEDADVRVTGVKADKR